MLNASYMKKIYRPVAASFVLLLSAGVTRLIPGEVDTARLLAGRSAIVTSRRRRTRALSARLRLRTCQKPFMTGSSTLRFTDCAPAGGGNTAGASGLSRWIFLRTLPAYAPRYPRRPERRHLRG